VRPRAFLNLGKIGLADAASQFFLDGANHLLLRHLAIQPANAAFYLAQVANFFAQLHRSLSKPLVITDRNNRIADCDNCQVAAGGKLARVANG